MRTLIFSDTHLTHHYEPELDRFLQSLIEGADQVVINGDFWDGFHTNWEVFAQSRWQGLFKLLRDKKAIVLWGNHDLPSWTKDPELFRSSTWVITFFPSRISSYTFHTVTNLLLPLTRTFLA